MIKKSKKNSVITGVCGGLGEKIGINPNWIRVGLAVSTVLVFHWITPIVYIGSALLMKKED